MFEESREELGALPEHLPGQVRALRRLDVAQRASAREPSDTCAPEEPPTSLPHRGRTTNGTHTHPSRKWFAQAANPMQPIGHQLSTSRAAQCWQDQTPSHLGAKVNKSLLASSANLSTSGRVFARPTASSSDRGQQPAVGSSACLLSGADRPATDTMWPLFATKQQAAFDRQAHLALQQQQQQQQQQCVRAHGYKKSPSLFEMSSRQREASGNQAATHSSSEHAAQTRLRGNLTSFLGEQEGARAQHQAELPLPVPTNGQLVGAGRRLALSNSTSLHDLKQPQVLASNRAAESKARLLSATNKTSRHDTETYEYKLAKMLLKLGSDPVAARDQDGCTALMHAILSRNLAAIKCLLEHGVDLDEINNEGLTALDLICSSDATDDVQIEMFQLLVEHHADFDRTRAADGTRLLDRLIKLHESTACRPDRDKLPYIDCLLHNGAKLGSSTWLAADGKPELQLRLLRKLCQDGYFLYKKASIEAAVYRFEYALKQIDHLEQGLQTAHSWPISGSKCQPECSQPDRMAQSMKRLKYQIYLGLSRCERKRKFLRRALEFAHMSILVDSSSYEGYYSKAHILKDMGEINESQAAIEQTERLINSSIECNRSQMAALQHGQERMSAMDGGRQFHDSTGSDHWIEIRRRDLVDDLDYLEVSKKHVTRLRCELELEAKLRSRNVD